MEEALQHETTTQRIGLSPASPGNHPSDGPKTGDALTFKMDHSSGADQVRAGYKTRYYKVSDLLYTLSMTREDEIFLREREKLAKFKLLVLDDFGKVAMSENEKSILFDIIEDRSGSLSTIIVGQRPYNDWHSFIDNPVIADAILDRLSRDRHHIKLRGDSLRRREAKFEDI